MGYIKYIFWKNKPKSQVVGFVDRLTVGQIEGWVISHKSKEPAIQLGVHGEVFDLSPRWQRRDDVMAQHGDAHKNAGFVVEWPSKVKNYLESSALEIKDIQVIADGVELEVIVTLPGRDPGSDPLADGRSAGGSDASGTVTLEGEALAGAGAVDEDALGGIYAFNHFMICGYMMLDAAVTPELSIRVDDAPVDWGVLWAEQKPDAAGSEVAVARRCDFELQIPGYVWERRSRSPEDVLNITLCAPDGEVVASLELSRQQASEWIAEISHFDDAKHLQYYALVALEHLRFSGLMESLDPACVGFYRDYAEKMQLENFIQAGLDAAGGAAPSAAHDVDFGTQLLWKLQKDLNRRVLADPDRVYAAVEATLEAQQPVQAELKQRFLLSVVPLLAKNGQLLELKQLLDFRDGYELDRSDNPWELSLSIALLIADRQIQRAADATWRLTKVLDRGWLNTECVWFSVSHTLGLLERAEVSREATQELVWAVLGIFDTLDGEWFSRIHDAMLHQATVVLLEQLDLVPDHQQNAIQRAAIRHFGLSPDFWNAVAASDCTVQEGSLLQRAHENWLAVAAALARDERFADEWQSALRALNFFSRQENKEATSMRRELISSLLQTSICEDPEALRGLIDAVVADDPMEAIRYAAHPFISEAAEGYLLQAYRSEVFDALRANGGKPVSASYHAQVQAAERLKQGVFGARGGVPMSGWGAHFLNLDLLVSAIARRPALTEDYLPLLDFHLHGAIAAHAADDCLAAPVCTAVAHLNRLAASDRCLKAFVADINRILTSKFGGERWPPRGLVDGEKTTPYLFDSAWPGDTLVVIYSCRAYLDSRIQAIRDTWLKDLQARQIPYLILVGDGEDRVNGDVLELDVADTYEKLPQKTLKLFEWVYANTNAQYVLKIDDDCFLNVDRFFDSLTYRKHHYYGRLLHRSEGGMDRAWHHAKSHTEHAQKTLDKSPEPAVYADGGGGYTLSRTAIGALVETAQTLQGQRLILHSFMEDKLVGDLLALDRIHPSNEDYECHQRRRMFSSAEPVSIYENIFFASKQTPTVVTHLDTERDQPMASRLKQSEGLWPKKIWPSCWGALTTTNSNQLELLTELTRARELNAKSLFVVAAMRNEMTLLPHFLQHYRDLGVEAFIIADNCSDDGTREHLLQQPDVILYSVDTEYKYSHYGVAWQQAMLANHCVGKWTLIADADELLVYPGMQQRSLSEFLQTVEQTGADCVRTDMIDMYPYGDLAEADFRRDQPFEVAAWHDQQPLLEWALGSGMYSNSQSWISSLRHRIDPNAEPNAFASQKYALIKYKPWMRFAQGIHDAAGVRVATTTAQFAHFKYHAGFKAKVEQEIQRKQHYDGAKEYVRYKNMLAESGGGFGDSQLSVPLKLKSS